MKKPIRILSLIALIAIISLPLSSFAFPVKKNKQYKKMEEKKEKMNKKGAFAVIGMAVASEGRIDLGRSKAQADAQSKMAQSKRAYIETTVHDFRESIGVGKGSENNDVFRQLTDAVSADILKGARIYEFDYFQSKANKKEGTYTYIVLYVVTPKCTYQSIVNELKKEKGSEENLYQRYVDSEAQKKHDAKIAEFKKEFKIDE